YGLGACARASAGTEPSPPVSVAISLRATTVIQGAPNDSARITSTTVATIQERRVSIEGSFMGSCILLHGCGGVDVPAVALMPNLRCKDHLRRDAPWRLRLKTGFGI